VIGTDLGGILIAIVGGDRLRRIPTSLTAFGSQAANYTLTKATPLILVGWHVRWLSA
jgi:ABC-type uncharacterized transport system permease subunit